MSPQRCLIADEGQRELATNRLLEIIRGGRDASGKPTRETPQDASARPPESPVGRSGAPPPQPSSPDPFRGATPPPRVFPPEEPPPGKRPGMGLLDKVLNKSAAAGKVSAASGQPAPTSVASMLSSPVPVEPKSARGMAEKKTDSASPVEAPPSEALMSSPQRLIRDLKARLSGGKSVTAKATPARLGKPEKSGRTGLKGKRIIAIDIGTSSIKLIELLKQGNSHTILSLESKQIPIAMRKNAAALTVLQTKLLREMLAPARIKGAEIHLLIPDKSAQARTVSIPGGAAKELVNAIKFQIKKDLPFPLDVCDISYRGFDPKHSGKQDIEILAVDRRAVESTMGLLEEIEILPSVVTAPAASTRFLVKDYTGIETGAGAVGIVDIGASHTTITVVEENRVVLSRTVVTGGDDFTAALTGTTLGPGGEELTDVQAEKYKIDVGLPSERDAATLKAAIQMRPIAERISTEVTRSLDFYRRARTGGEIKKIIMAGGGSLLKRLPEFISENTGVDIVLGTPTARLTLAGGRSDVLESMATELGPVFLSGLAVALDDGREFNMLPASVKGTLKLRRAQGVVAPAAIGMMVILIVAYVLALGAKNSLESKMEQVRSQLGGLDLSRARFLTADSRYEELVDQLNNRQADFDSIRMGEPEIPRYLKALSNLTPDNVYLSRLATKFLSETDEEKAEARSKDTGTPFSMEAVMSSFTKSFGDPLSARNQEESEAPPVKRPIYGRVIEIEGVIYPFGTMTDVQLVDYVFGLENSGHFRDVAVDSMSTSADGKVQFRILCGM